MPSTTETASFRGNDDVCLVEASLACSLCLSGDVEWRLDFDEEDYDARVDCHCESCGHVRTVWLTGEQALRLSLDRRPADAL